MSTKQKLNAILAKIAMNKSRLYNNEADVQADCVLLEDVDNTYDDGNGNGQKEGEHETYNGWLEELQALADSLPEQDLHELL